MPLGITAPISAIAHTSGRPRTPLTAPLANPQPNPYRPTSRSGGAARPKSSRRAREERTSPSTPERRLSPSDPLGSALRFLGQGADIAARTEPPKKGVLAPPRRFHGARDWRRGSLKAGGRSPHEAGALPETNESVIGGPLAARRASMAGGPGRSGAAEKGGPEGAVRVGRGARGAQAGCATPARAASGT